MIQYFRTIFASSHPGNSVLNEVLSVVQPRVTTQMNRTLAEPFTALEVKQAVFANRPKPLLDHIVSHTQSAFIPGRLITDNVLVAFELNHHLKISTQTKGGCAAIKLDMSKAYDRVEWPFLRGVLLRLRLLEKFNFK
ncbi:UNVERIFIED_CONTAM: hypothetical protein Slati_0098400 [Sesamum latifolium]|uniref:Reverse transcriptase domain-containing protein n=1 Tax=Sesamum latifolium TaxID=2727402 RepID=A0AAW2Y8L9_9LAMI